ncbi:MAG: hypothetical protein CL734_04115 [Chloroflexi bacterium]|nr:hypothetical protein [Chloroflexota bacterium]|tara:strand:+ start:120 stop:776 length:657 start_codon:yes stop_codon:yes gene_type:complete
MNNNLLIQMDFDNTITRGHISEKFHQHFKTSNWNKILKKYRDNKISVEESNILSFENCLVPCKEIKFYVENNIEFREGVKNFLCDMGDFKELKIVSSGVDFWVLTGLNKLQIDLNNIDVICGKSTFTNKGINVEYFDFDDMSIRENFKFHYTKKFKEQGYKVLYIGDSITDLNSALISDYVFATDELQKILKNERIPFFCFKDFKFIKNKVREILGPI